MKKNHTTKKTFKAAQSFLHGIGRDAYLDWALSVTLAFVLVLVLISISYFTFMRTSVLKVPANSGISTAKKALFNQNDLDKVLKAFDDRSAESNQLKGGYSGVGDPSI